MFTKAGVTLKPKKVRLMCHLPLGVATTHSFPYSGQNPSVYTRRCSPSDFRDLDLHFDLIDTIATKCKDDIAIFFYDQRSLVQSSLRHKQSIYVTAVCEPLKDFVFERDWPWSLRN